MVTKIKTGKNTLGALLYNENKVKAGTAECISANLYGREVAQLSIPEKHHRFQRLQELNRNAKTNTLHLSLNFDPFEKFNNGKLIQIADDYMRRIGFSGQPYLVYRHDDAAHPHLHILTTNIKAGGQRIDLHGIGRNQSETARKAIEIEYGLVKAEEQRHQASQELKPLTYGDQPTKAAVSSVVSYLVNTYKFSSLAELSAILREYNITADLGPEDSRQRHNNGLNYFILDTNGRKTGVPIKASSINIKPTLKNLEKRFEKNKLNKAAPKPILAAKLDTAFAMPGLSKEAFIKALKNQNITINFRVSELGQIYGITYIDHVQKVVFNGSELGKPYAAKAVLQRLAQNAAQPRTGNIATIPYAPNALQSHIAKNNTPAYETPARTPNLLETLLEPEFQAPVPVVLKKRKRKKRRPLNP